MSSHPRTAVRYYFRMGSILRRHLPLLSGLPCSARLFFWRLFSASPRGPPREKPQSALSSGYDRPGVSLLLRYKGSIAVALCRVPRCVPPHHISSSSCCSLAAGSLPLYDQSQGSGSTDLTFFLRTLQDTHPIFMWAALRSFMPLTSSKSTYAFLFPI